MSIKKFSEKNFTFGKNLKALRKTKGYTLKSLGKKIDVSPGFLSEVESGKKMPGGEILYSLKRTLGVQIDSLFEEVPQKMEELRNEKSKLNKSENSELNQLLKSQIGKLEKDKEYLQKVIERLHDEIERLHEDKAELREQIAELKKEITTLEKGRNTA
jgi:transcriptional regulator with XRE-family HTH domain